MYICKVADMKNYKVKKRIREGLLVSGAFAVGYTVGMIIMRDAMFKSFKMALAMAAEMVEEAQKAS
jgi:hypothetical protein